MLELARPASWDDLAKVWRAVQGDLQLPAPSIAVSGIDGFQLWFSFAVSVPTEQAIGLIELLRRRYLGDIALERITIQPCVVDVAASGHGQHEVLPPVQRAIGQWSAFVAPDLAKLFAQEPWLDVSPGPDAQADLLSRLDCMKPEALKLALQLLSPGDAPRSAETLAMVGASRAESGPVHTPPAADVSGPTPRVFLLGIMNDPAIELHLRIEAAKALLPYWEGHDPH